MIVDSSAILGILNDEPGADEMSALLAMASIVRLSAATSVELQAVSTRRYGGEIDRAIERLLDVMSMTIVPVTLGHADIAREAYRRFGIGTGHPARLNFGDCFAYALAKDTGEPLLFKDDHFVHTDITPALFPAA